MPSPKFQEYDAIPLPCPAVVTNGSESEDKIPFNLTVFPPVNTKAKSAVGNTFGVIAVKEGDPDISKYFGNL